MHKKVVIIGAGGHAKVIADIVIKSQDTLLGFLDDNLEKGKKVICDYCVLGKISKCIALQEQDKYIEFIIAIGNNSIRKDISNKYKLNYYTAIHPSAQIGLETTMEEGTAIMANACINSSAKIGKHCIINTGAIIEHDNIIEDYVHISPQVALGGTIKVGENTHVGIGATVKNNLEICKNCTIGAGAVVVKNIEGEGTYVGVPAKKKRTKNNEDNSSGENK